MALNLETITVPDAKLVQAGLKHFGYYDGTMFGKPGPKTKTAYSRYLNDQQPTTGETPLMPGALLDYPSTVMQELDFPGDIRKGAQGRRARRVQEWVSIHGFKTVIDEDFRDATVRAVRLFQAARGLSTTGEVDQATWKELVAPMMRAFSTIDHGSQFSDTVRRVAEQHLREHPIELGGSNFGPWVRAYMGGHQGKSWPWCAGFVTFVMKQAAKVHGVNTPIKGSFSCDLLASQADKEGRFVAESSITDLSNSSLGSCCIFLVRRTSDDWTHTGFAMDYETTSFATIEGNTNDDGNWEGYEVCRRIRSLAKRDFIKLD